MCPSGVTEFGLIDTIDNVFLDVITKGLGGPPDTSTTAAVFVFVLQIKKRRIIYALISHVHSTRMTRHQRGRRRIRYLTLPP